MWFLPIALIVFTLIIAIPLSKYIAWIMDGKYRPLAFFRWFGNAEFQLDRVAAKWAEDAKRDVADIRKEIDQIRQTNASAPFKGLVGEKFLNVLEVNLELSKRCGVPK